MDKVAEIPSTPPSAPMRVARPVFDRLTQIKNELTTEKRRNVSYSEVLEMLLDEWDQKGLNGRYAND